MPDLLISIQILLVFRVMEVSKIEVKNNSCIE